MNTYTSGMGRPDLRAVDRHAPIKWRLVKIRLNSNGYDSGGAYWGRGDDLWFLQGKEIVPLTMGPDDMPEAWLRANSREEAKAKVLQDYPNSTFCR